MRDYIPSKTMKTVRSFEAWFWHTKHPLCLRCEKECKQSDKVRIIRCPQCKVKDDAK